MSKNKVIVVAVLEGGMSKAEAARRYGISRQWVHQLIARHAAEGEAGLEARSRRPRTSPQQTPANVQERILVLRADLQAKGLDSGAETIAAHLGREGLPVPASTTIHRILRAAGAVAPEPHKRPKSSLRRFAAAQPNETWQSDFTHWHLADGTDTEIIDFLDDHSRCLLHLTAHPRTTGAIVVDAFLDTAQEHGLPASTLTDNGMVYTTRLAGGKGGRNAFESLIAGLGIVQKNGSPGHPQTQGKIERFHQTLKKWLHSQPPAQTIEDLNDQLTRFRHVYNHERPHRALGRHTPAEAYAQTPKAGPAAAAQGAHFRVRTDRVDADGKVTLRHAGRLRHLGIGRAHRHKRIILLVHDAEATAIEHGTGEILAEFTINPTRGYQPKKQNTPGPKTGGVNDVPPHP
ncbi:IS481 family transposase [Sinomonas sp. ASV486]|uniref:IS481 family transposase n=3 Tax=Sinomonas sp. ASV486 TaxID=3051170 RepID=UPI0027DE54B2|nr:IS481 family transposase [Sinomonas sp. ASV486]MDQ4491363.1 IS481 family transposase [Sinomonas sp. ASV486]MDQ4491364.1 IS481 family transposase [Sinomonas sp. ASV486]MDQ4492369.1 IS481 family transposase [Sinomonas sp. ASV486]